MRNRVFNSTFENMLRILLMIDTMNEPANVDRLAALDFICIYGKKCKVLDKNYTQLLHAKGNLDLKTVFLLDQVQKRKTISK